MAPFIFGLLRPTATLPSEVSRALGVRQTTVTVTAAPSAGGGGGGSSNNLSGGAIAGIVIGSIAAFLLLWWIVRSCSNLGAPPSERAGPAQTAWYDDVAARRSPPRRHRRHSRGSYSRSPGRQPEMVAVRQSRSRSARRPSPVYVQQPHTHGRRGSRGDY